MSCGIVGKVGTGAKQESEDKPRKGSHGSGSGKGKEMSKAARRKAAAWSRILCQARDHFTVDRMLVMDIASNVGPKPYRAVARARPTSPAAVPWAMACIVHRPSPSFTLRYMYLFLTRRPAPSLSPSPATFAAASALASEPVQFSAPCGTTRTITHTGPSLATTPIRRMYLAFPRLELVS